MADSIERGHVGALLSNIESKICYHRDATLEYMEIKTVLGEAVKEQEKLQDDNMQFLNTIETVVEEKQNLQHDHQAMVNLVTPMENELEMTKKELKEAKLAAKELEEAKLAAEKELAQKNEELELLRRKLQESEAVHIQLEQQNGIAPDPVQSRMVTRSTHKQEMQLKRLLGNNADRQPLKKQRSDPQLEIVDHRASGDDDLDVVRQKLIKGFTEIEAECHIGIKEMGKLNEKPFRVACAMKQSGPKASQLYAVWQELLNNPNWNPFKTITVDGNRQEEVIDVDDDRLQGLHGEKALTILSSLHWWRGKSKTPMEQVASSIFGTIRKRGRALLGSVSIISSIYEEMKAVPR